MHVWQTVAFDSFFTVKLWPNMGAFSVVLTVLGFLSALIKTQGTLHKE